MRSRRRANLGLGTLTALVVGNMIGAGVFTTSGFALADLGSPARVLWAWAVGGAIALCGALGYGALVRALPLSGGEYLYLSRILHPIAGFIAGWVSLLAGFTAAIAFAALTLAAYVLPEGQASDGPLAGAVASGVILLAALLHALGVRIGTRVQNLAVAVKIVAMLAFVAFALFAGEGPSSWPGVVRGADDVPPFSIGAFATSVMWISFSYSGFNAAVYVAGEVPAARARVPCALLAGTVATASIYVALNAIFVLAPSFEAVAGREDVAAAAARELGGDALVGAVRAIVVLALFTSVSAMIMIGPRVYAQMADDGLMPRVLRLEAEVPVAAVLMQAVLAVAVVWIAGLRELLSYLGFTLSLSSALTVASSFVVARRERGRGRRAARWLGYPWAPAAFVAATLLFAALAARSQPVELVAAVVTIASGAGLYVLAARGSGRPPGA